MGIPQNWEIALSQPIPIWGLKPIYKNHFLQSLSIGDFLWFYCTDIARIIGVGTTKDKYIDNIKLIWPDELKQKKVIWPLRFRINVLKVLPFGQWKTNGIRINDFELMWQKGFQALNDEHISELFKRAENLFGEDLFIGTTISQPLIREKQSIYAPSEEIPQAFSHKQLQDQLAEIGKLQFYYAEVEYPINLAAERRNLDVVWKREIDGAPTFAFEIELSGMLEKAIERLKFAFRRWNSRPRIVIPNDFVQQTHNILTTSERDFSHQIKIYEPNQIVSLLNRKRELKTVEQNLELY